ncbi:hypothetical protein U1Q18_019959 [Sarracenia purpurea var. burkii]
MQRAVREPTRGSSYLLKDAGVWPFVPGGSPIAPGGVTLGRGGARFQTGEEGKMFGSSPYAARGRPSVHGRAIFELGKEGFLSGRAKIASEDDGYDLGRTNLQEYRKGLEARAADGWAGRGKSMAKTAKERVFSPTPNDHLWSTDATNAEVNIINQEVPAKPNFGPYEDVANISQVDESPLELPTTNIHGHLEIVAENVNEAATHLDEEAPITNLLVDVAAGSRYETNVEDPEHVKRQEVWLLPCGLLILILPGIGFDLPRFRLVGGCNGVMLSSAMGLQLGVALV